MNTYVSIICGFLGFSQTRVKGLRPDGGHNYADCNL